MLSSNPTHARECCLVGLASRVCYQAPPQIIIIFDIFCAVFSFFRHKRYMLWLINVYTTIEHIFENCQNQVLESDLPTAYSSV